MNDLNKPLTRRRPGFSIWSGYAIFDVKTWLSTLGTAQP